MKVKDFNELYLTWLLDIKSLEEQLVKSLPKVAEKATNPNLKNAILAHHQQTENHLARVELLLTRNGQSTHAPKCDAMAGIIKEVDEIIHEVEPGSLLDAAIVGAAQKVEHYEIATYGTAAQFAKLLGLTDDVATLELTLSEEYGADDHLTAIAKAGVNSQAMSVVGR